VHETGEGEILCYIQWNDVAVGKQSVEALCDCFWLTPVGGLVAGRNWVDLQHHTLCRRNAGRRSTSFPRFCFVGGARPHSVNSAGFRCRVNSRRPVRGNRLQSSVFGRLALNCVVAASAAWTSNHFHHQTASAPEGRHCVPSTRTY